MLYNRIQSSKAAPFFVDSATDLLQETSRKLIYLNIFLIALWQVSSGIIWDSMVGLRLVPISLGLVLLSFLALRLIPRNFLLAQIFLQVSIALGIGGYAYLAQSPLLLIALGIVPLTASVMIGWQGAVVAEGMLIGIVIWHNQISPPTLMLPSINALTIFFGATLGVIGWITISSLMTVTEWAVYSYQEAADKIKRARDRQLELLQVQHDLLLANNELARLSNRLKIMTHLAEEARRVKQEFVANVSHELRTPLNMIIGFTETIVHSPRLYGNKISPKLMADISAIHRNSQQLIALINDVLDLSQIEAGKVVLNKKWHTIDHLVLESMNSVQALFDSKGLYLTQGRRQEDLEVYCDGTRIREVLLNLLSNAGRYTEQGGVSINYWQDGEHVILSVTDTGPGISQKDQERLFQPFQQLGTYERRHEGSGLGLSISKQFVEMHDGKMWLESEIGKGTTFYFSLPYENGVAAQVAVSGSLRWINEFAVKEPRRRSFVAPTPVVKPRYILLDKGSALRHLLQRFDAEVEIRSVSQIDDALLELQRSPTQGLIVNRSSQDLPLTLQNRLPYGTPIISCTVTADEDISQQLGIARYLVKPVTREQILSSIAEVTPNGQEVLIINQNTEELQLYVRILESSEKKYFVLRSTSPEQALDLLKSRNPDLVLLNLTSEDQEVLNLLEKKVQDPEIASIPVILVAAQDPYQAILVGNSFEVKHCGELLTVDFLNCIRAITSILAPISPSAIPKPPETLPAEPASE